jgi:hypothetical protein
MPDDKPARASKVVSAAPLAVSLPPKPTFAKDHRIKEKEHQRKPKRQGRFRRVKDIGEPAAISEPRQ